MFIFLQFPNEKGHICTCKEGADGTFCVHAAFAFLKLFTLPIVSQVSVQFSYSRDDWDTILRNAPPEEDQMTSGTSAYWVGKDEKNWRQAYCNSCKAQLNRTTMRVWTHTRFFKFKEKIMCQTMSKPFFCVKRDCFQNFIPKNGVIASPFLNNYLNTRSRDQFTTEELNIFENERIQLREVPLPQSN